MMLIKCFLLRLHQCCGVFPLRIHSPLHVPCNCLVDSDANLSGLLHCLCVHTMLYVIAFLSWLVFKCYCDNLNS